MQPRRSRVKPAPFQRDGINIEKHGKAWQTISATHLSVGDIVAGHGAVEFVWFSDVKSVQAHVKFVSGQSVTFDVNDDIYAFTEKRNGKN